jgi:photosystem II stability/assembly factor-like uncharacterized protein
VLHVRSLCRALPLLASAVALPLTSHAQAAAPPASAAGDITSGMRWRHIGPFRGGRARALTGVPSQPNTFYIGYDNGGVWRSTDYGSNWVPLFDEQSTGSIGAIAVAPGNPKIIYVGSGAGIIRPDLAVGDGMYKSTDGGATWTHLGLRNSQMIAMIDVDPTNPDRLYVAVLGHPYGPNSERGVYRSTDGGVTFERVLYRDEYTSANDVRIDPRNPNVLYATLWKQQQSFIEGQGFSGAAGIFKSTDGGTTWRQLTDGLPELLQANLAIAGSNPNVLYATVANVATPTAPSTVKFYKSVDAGEHWSLAIEAPSVPRVAGRAGDPRPMARIGGGDLPTLYVDPKNENVVYSASTVMWRTEDAGLSWSAVRGAPGGDDYQRIWINPNDPNIVAAVADQGAVISANRGESWSNWYNQPTAAMYHVTADNAFPYRLCSGQQDSGSACVNSRSDDGMITFHDWHPVNIQEYGIAAPDPRDPDIVFGSMRTGISRYSRRTKQTTYVGPNTEGFSRNVRTMPLHFSPVNPDALYYASNVVWKSLDRGQSWARISPDLTRQTWEIPATAAHYAASVKVAPAGALTALALSPRDEKVIWSGSDDGSLHVTTNGGTTWANVTPPQVKPWTRIYNLEAGHFDAKVAYAAANTLRLDDMNPHFLRTRDGGKTWTEINTGITPGNVANSIREDPRQRGLLYAATDAQVWVSYDDGEHWESLRLNMPAISVRDIAVKDDSTCHCSDLVIGTHGRGFWILDNITTLRQAAVARAADTPYLFAPPVALRVRFATNDPTPWPREMPAGENPLPGGIIDYRLARDASAPVTLQIRDASGTVVRRYSSADLELDPHPALDPVAYNRVCQATPSAPFCNVPLYWPAKPIRLHTRAGMHRFAWDLRMDPLPRETPQEVNDEEATGAVPGRTYPQVDAPWAPPGAYRVELTVDGTTFTQPLTLRLDPRVRTPAPALGQLATVTRGLWARAHEAHRAHRQARALAGLLEREQGAAAVAFRAQLDSIAPATPAGVRPRGRRRGVSAAASLAAAATSVMAAATAMQWSDVAPTRVQLDAARFADRQAADVLARWRTLQTTGLAAVNTARRAAGQSAIVLPAIAAP